MHMLLRYVAVRLCLQVDGLVAPSRDQNASPYELGLNVDDVQQFQPVRGNEGSGHIWAHEHLYN